MLLITVEAHAGLNVHKAKHSQATGEFSRTSLLGRNQKHTKPNKQQIKSFPTNHGISLLLSPEKQSNQPQNPRRKQSKDVCPANEECQGVILGLRPSGGKGSSYSTSPSLGLGQSMSRWACPGDLTQAEGLGSICCVLTAAQSDQWWPGHLVPVPCHLSVVTPRCNGPSPACSTWLLWVILWDGTRGSWAATAPRKLQTAPASRDLQHQGIDGKVSRARGTNWNSPCVFCLLTAGLGTSRTWKGEFKPPWLPVIGTVFVLFCFVFIQLDHITALC